MTGVTNLSGTDLNAACSGPVGGRPSDGPTNSRSQQRGSLEDEVYLCGNGQAPVKGAFLRDGDSVGRMYVLGPITFCC
ncbi:hypothetical protein FO131_01920 [Salmonella bongori]|nr:hypothetical protein [Salmonella bongori serovar 48:i:-]ECG9251348.1 hypothetical protein [Salmonella bongori]EGE4654236.1 hypothetical protein [Salmonella bongori serovar 40:z35:- str. 95-0123]EGE4660421.1 hypothetical protein [Salmonella bongori serovar 48:i:- str. 94-0708]TNB53859.1 hypothetical protein FGW25_01935 [Salmonella bongori serovar 48:z35:-]